MRISDWSSDVCSSDLGAEANEGAIKLARKWGWAKRNGAYKIITMNHGFHGRTLATMSASGKPGWDTMFAPQVDGFPKAELTDQNGRASFRDRVCPYCSITVVVV